MRLPVPDRRFGMRFDITPLIDVVFLLIIFFLVSSHFVRSETLQEVELPRATQAMDDNNDEQTRRLLITITSDRQFHIAGRTVSRLDLESIIARAAKQTDGQLEVRIRGDQSVPFGDVEPVLLLCAQIGITDVKFAVLPEHQDRK